MKILFGSNASSIALEEFQPFVKDFKRLINYAKSIEGTNYQSFENNKLKSLWPSYVKVAREVKEWCSNFVKLKYGFEIKEGVEDDNMTASTYRSHLSFTSGLDINDEDNYSAINENTVETILQGNNLEPNNVNFL
jgi:hypothetical protein